MRAADVSKEHPATLRRTSDDVEVQVEDPAEYHTLTSTAGYRDVTSDKQAKQAEKASAKASTSGGSSSSS